MKMKHTSPEQKSTSLPKQEAQLRHLQNPKRHNYTITWSTNFWSEGVHVSQNRKQNFIKEHSTKHDLRTKHKYTSTDKKEVWVLHELENKFITKNTIHYTLA